MVKEMERVSSVCRILCRKNVTHQSEGVWKQIITHDWNCSPPPHLSNCRQSVYHQGHSDPMTQTTWRHEKFAAHNRCSFLCGPGDELATVPTLAFNCLLNLTKNRRYILIRSDGDVSATNAKKTNTWFNVGYSLFNKWKIIAQISYTVPFQSPLYNML